MAQRIDRPGPVKVLRVVGGLEPTRGGPPVSALNGAVAAQRAGAATTLAFPADRGPTPDVRPALARLRAANIETRSFPYLARPDRLARYWAISPGLARWIVRHRCRFDIVHCHGAWHFCTLVVALLRRAGGPPAVLTPHESLTAFDIAQSSTAWTRLAKRRLRPLYLRRFDRIVLASEIEARDSVPAGLAGRARTLVIRHPVYDETVRRAGPRAGPRAPGRLRLGFLGRLHVKKNLDVLIAALARLPEAVTLAVAGEGPEEARLKALAAEAGVAARIEWLGFVADADKAGFFAAIDLLALPSQYECFGMAAAEAMAEGLPVLVTPETGVAEVVSAYGGGAVVAPEADAVARAVEAIRRDPARLAQLSRGAVEAAAGELSFAAHGARMMRCYEELV